MSALSTPGGGGTTAQSKPTSGKPKFQKLDINSLYCANKNESSEPSSVKSQLSRKHGMQSLGKVPSARRPPANLPSLKTETGQDSNTISTSVTPTTVTPPTTCAAQTINTTSTNMSAGTGPGGWVQLPPPSSPHFRTEFPSLEAAAQPSHRTSDHSTTQPQLRPQTEGSWTCGGTAGVRQDPSSPAAAPASTPVSQQAPVYRAILPSFLMKGSSGSGLGMGTLGALRDSRSSGGASGGNTASSASSRQPLRAPVTPRAVEVLTARPILREEQISSLDDISHDAGWAQQDDIDYDQKLDFSDGETSAPANKTRNKNTNNRSNVENESVDVKNQEPGDEEQLWAERRQKHNNEMAQVAARARQIKEEEQRRQMRESVMQHPKDSRTDRIDRDRNDYRDRDAEQKDKDRNDNREKEQGQETREKDRNENRDKELNREVRDKERIDARDRFENRDRDRDTRDRDRDTRDRDRDTRERDRMDVRERDRLEPREKVRNDVRERQENDKERIDARDRDRNDNRDRDRDRFEKDRERPDRDRFDRERTDRDRDFRERDRDYGRDRDQTNPAFSKTFQANIPPRFLKQQQNRQQDDQHKPWAFTGKPAPPRRQEPPPTYNPPRYAHNGRRSFSRDYSDREDEFHREKDAVGPQWRSEMHDYEKSARDLDRSNSKEHGDYKDRRNDSDRKLIDSFVEPSSRTSAAEKLTEVFERKSIGLAEPFASVPSDPSSHIQITERRNSPPSNLIRRESAERDFGKTSWAEVTQDEPSNFTVLKLPSDKTISSKDNPQVVKDLHPQDKIESNISIQQKVVQTPHQPIANVASVPISSPNQISKYVDENVSNFSHPASVSQANTFGNILQQTIPTTQSQTNLSDTQLPSKNNQPLSKPITPVESISNVSHAQTPSAEQILPVTKPTYTLQKSEVSESESVASKSSTDPSRSAGTSQPSETISGKPVVSNTESQRHIDERKSERFSNEQLNKIPSKEPIERKSSGSGSEKKGRGYGAGGFAVYNNRGWGSRESRGRRSHRSSRSNNRASESDASTDGVPNTERKERRRAPRSPRGPKKPDIGKSEDLGRPPQMVQVAPVMDGMENREPFAPRGQPSRRGRGGFQGTSRPPAPAKRVAGYGPPNTKSPFSQANRAVKENEDCKDNQIDDKGKAPNNNRPRNTSSGGRGRDRRPKGGVGPLSGEDENWETTSEHSESGGAVGRRRSVGGRPGVPQKGQGGRNQNSNRNGRNFQGGRKDSQLDNKTTDISDATSDNKTSDITEAMIDLKLSSIKKDDDVVDDGFQEVRNKKNSKDARGPNPKEENQQPLKQPRSHSNQGNGRNGSSSRNSNDKSNSRGSAPVSNKPGSQYERPRQPNLAPRFVKQRQKQQMGLTAGFGPDTGAAPPPPPVNAWDKPISQTLRGNIEESVEVVEIKPTQTSQRSSPGDVAVETKNVPNACTLGADKAGVLDGATPPVETIIFENTNYKTAPPAEALKQKYQTVPTATKSQEDIPAEMDARPMNFNGDVRTPPARTIQELIIAENNRPAVSEEGSIGLQMNFDPSQKTEDSSDMKLDFAFDSDLGQLTDDKSAKALVGLPRATHMSTSNTISPLAADLNLKIASVKKVWEMPAVAEGSEELQFAGFEEANIETGAPPNVCKVKPTQQLQSPPPQHYNHVGYQGGYGGLSSPPAVLFNSSQQLLSSSQQLPQQGGLYGAFLDQSRGQFGGFPGTPYGAGSAAPYNYQPPPDMFQSLPSQYRMAAAAAGGGAAFGQSGQLGNNPSTVLISSTSNSLMSATVKPSSQQIGAIGSKGGGVGGVGGVNTYQQQYLGYSGPVGEAPYSLQGLLPRPAPPANSYYSPYQPQAAPAPTYPLQFTQPAQSSAFSSQFLSSQLQVAAAVQQMQQQYRAPLQQQFVPQQPQPQPRGPPQPALKSPLHEHANGFPLDGGSPTPKGKPKAPHSPPQHKYHAPPPPHHHMQHPPPSHTPHQHHPHQQHQQHQQQMVGGNNGRCGSGGGARGPSARFPAPIQRPLAPALPMYRAPPQPLARHHAPRPNLYYHHQRS